MKYRKIPEHKEKAIKGMNVLNDMVFSLINMIMLVSPIGVFFLMGDSFGSTEPASLPAWQPW